MKMTHMLCIIENKMVLFQNVPLDWWRSQPPPHGGCAHKTHVTRCFSVVLRRSKRKCWGSSFKCAVSVPRLMNDKVLKHFFG